MKCDYARYYKGICPNEGIKWIFRKGYPTRVWSCEAHRKLFEIQR
jgi:hypothetical protein